MMVGEKSLDDRCPRVLFFSRVTLLTVRKMIDNYVTVPTQLWIAICPVISFLVENGV